MNQQLIDNNFLIVRNFISKEEANNLAEEFLIAIKNNAGISDWLCPSSPAIYNFIPYVRILIKKISEIESLIEEEILPTYAYGRIYRTNDILPRHEDHERCEISLTLNLQTIGEPWEIWIKTPNKEEVSVELNAGDAMLYLGCDAEHWRNPFNGESCIQAFLHYVLSHGPKSHFALDKLNYKH